MQCAYVPFSYFSSEYMSSRLFWMGVPVTAQRARALSWQTAMEVCTLGFLMLWASSRTTRAQATRSRGAEGVGWGTMTRNEMCVVLSFGAGDNYCCVEHIKSNISCLHTLRMSTFIKILNHSTVKCSPHPYRQHLFWDFQPPPSGQESL